MREPVKIFAIAIIVLVIILGIIILFYPSKPSAEEEQAIKDAINDYYKNSSATITVSYIKVIGNDATASATISSSWTAPSGVKGTYASTYELTLKKSDGQWEVVSEEHVLTSP